MLVLFRETKPAYSTLWSVEFCVSLFLCGWTNHVVQMLLASNRTSKLFCLSLYYVCECEPLYRALLTSLYSGSCCDWVEGMARAGKLSV